LMKVSIITVAFNAGQTIGDTIDSVASQSYKNIEHIVIDGESTDGTMDVVEQHASTLSQIVSEPDFGIYDAMNKGIGLASGDIVGFLNADDIFADNSVVEQIVAAHQDQSLDACYADLVFVKQNDLDHVTRYWRSRKFQSGLCFKGWMPAHPTLYLKRAAFDKVGLFDQTLRYQADLEFCARAFEKHRLNSRYIPKLWVRMRLGGVSTGSVKTMIKGNWESYLALRKLGLKRDPLTYFLIKFGSKLPSFFLKH